MDDEPANSERSLATVQLSPNLSQSMSAVPVIPTIFTREQFEQTCILFAQEFSHSKSLNYKLDLVRGGWKWIPHQLNGYGYLTRRRRLFTTDTIHDNQPDADLEVDVATSSYNLRTYWMLNDYIIYSSTFQIPAYCFSLHDACEQT